MSSLMSFVPFVTIDNKSVNDFYINVIKEIQVYKSDNRSIVLYDIIDGESAEDIADKLYNNVDYDFLIYALNDMTNPLEDWPMSSNSLLDYCLLKYENINEIIQYRSIENDMIVYENWPSYDRYSLTAIEYETKENEKRRKIKLLIPEVATSVYRQCKSLLRA